MAALWPSAARGYANAAEIEQQVEQWLASMSVEQKVGQIIQPDFRFITPAQAAEYHIGSVLSGGGATPNDNRQANAAEWLAVADAFYDAGLAGGVVVPLIWGIDALHGHNNFSGATLFPHNIGLGASRNPALAGQIAAATAIEVAVTGLDWTFAPTLAVTRDDRWGRTYESFSESVDVVCDFTAPVLNGYQGSPDDTDFMRGRHVIATAKHYIGDGGTDQGIDQGDTLCNEDTLFNIHGKPYVEALQAGAQVVMASFSSWQGDKMHGHRYLLQQVLKDKMGFDGFVISDWNGHGQLENSTNVSAWEAINAGIDMLMSPEDWQGLWYNTRGQVTSGEIPAARLDDAVRRILRVKLRAGITFPNRPSSRPCAGKAELVGCAEHRQIARQAVRESAVLLKNKNQALPLARDATVLLAGPGADNIGMQCGGWSVTWQGDDVTNSDFPGATSMAAALTDALGESRVVMSDNPEDAADVDAIVYVFGEQPYAEGYGDLEHLSYNNTTPTDLVALKALKATGKPVISVFFTGRPLWTNPELNQSDAFVVAWLPGTEASGLIDVLCAADGCDFTAKLPFSWPSLASKKTVNGEPQGNEPLLPVDYGLTYQSTETGPDLLSEVDGIEKPTEVRELYIFERRPVAPLVFFAGDSSAWKTPITGQRFFSKGGVIQINTVDWQRQEDARRIRWTGSPGQVYFLTDHPMNCGQLISNGAAIELTLNLHARPTGDVVLRIDSKYPRRLEVDITELLSTIALNEWQMLTIDLSQGRDIDFDSNHVNTPFMLWTEGEMDLTLGRIHLTSLSASPQSG